MTAAGFAVPVPDEVGMYRDPRGDVEMKAVLWPAEAAEPAQRTTQCGDEEVLVDLGHVEEEAADAKVSGRLIDGVASEGQLAQPKRHVVSAVEPRGMPSGCRNRAPPTSASSKRMPRSLTRVDRRLASGAGPRSPLGECGSLGCRRCSRRSAQQEADEQRDRSPRFDSPTPSGTIGGRTAGTAARRKG